MRKEASIGATPGAMLGECVSFFFGFCSVFFFVFFSGVFVRSLGVEQWRCAALLVASGKRLKKIAKWIISMFQGLINVFYVI